MGGNSKRWLIFEQVTLARPQHTVFKYHIHVCKKHGYGMRMLKGTCVIVVLFDCYTFCEISGLVNIQSADRCDVVGQHLEWDDGHYRAKHPRRFRHP